MASIASSSLPPKTLALRVLKFGRKQISTSSIIPLKKFYKFLCEEENITRWTVTTDSDNVNIGDQVKVIKDEFVESTIEDTKGIIDENIFVNEKTVTIKKIPHTKICPHPGLLTLLTPPRFYYTKFLYLPLLLQQNRLVLTTMEDLLQIQHPPAFLLK